MSDQDRYRAAARATFQALKQDLEKIEHSWRVAHAFDTAIDYFLNVDKTGSQDFGNLVLRKTGGRVDRYEDSGWWTIAALRAFENPPLFGNLERFGNLVVDNWKRFNNNAPKTWERAKDKPGYKDFAPRFEGGVWNANWTAPCCDPYHREEPPCPKPNTLCGTQNTLTNGLYLISAARLFLNGHFARSSFPQAAASREVRFLWDWLSHRNENDNSLLKYVLGGGAVVRERATTYLSGKRDTGYRPDFAWAGDQGLILGGLSDMMTISRGINPEYPAYLDMVTTLLQGFQVFLADQNTNIILPWNGGGPPDGRDADYWTGPAVFTRYALHAFQNNPDVKQVMQKMYFPDFIRQNADHAIAQPMSSPDPNTDLVYRTNDLAALTMAVVVS
jgi:hypothetical protein